MFSTEAPPASPSPANEAPQPPPHYKIVVPDMGVSHIHPHSWAILLSHLTERRLL